MPQKSANPRMKMSGRALARTKGKSASQLRNAWILSLSVLVLIGAVSWAVCSEEGGWSGWVRGLRANRSSPGSPDAGESGAHSLRLLGDGYATLGKFLVDRRENYETTLTISFQLSGQTICRDEEAFQEFARRDYPAFRRHVASAVQDCDFSALTDEESLQRKVVVRVNRLLGRHFLKSVQFDQLTIHETIGSYDPVIWRPPKEAER